MRLFHELWKYILMLDQKFREELREDYTAIKEEYIEFSYNDMAEFLERVKKLFNKE